MAQHPFKQAHRPSCRCCSRSSRSSRWRSRSRGPPRAAATIDGRSRGHRASTPARRCRRASAAPPARRRGWTLAKRAAQDVVALARARGGRDRASRRPARRAWSSPLERDPAAPAGGDRRARRARRGGRSRRGRRARRRSAAPARRHAAHRGDHRRRARAPRAAGRSRGIPTEVRHRRRRRWTTPAIVRVDVRSGIDADERTASRCRSSRWSQTSARTPRDALRDADARGPRATGRLAPRAAAAGRASCRWCSRSSPGPRTTARASWCRSRPTTPMPVDDVAYGTRARRRRRCRSSLAAERVDSWTTARASSADPERGPAAPDRRRSSRTVNVRSRRARRRRRRLPATRPGRAMSSSSRRRRGGASGVGVGAPRRAPASPRGRRAIRACASSRSTASTSRAPARCDAHGAGGALVRAVDGDARRRRLAPRHARSRSWASTSATATGRSRRRSCSSCATSSSRRARTAPRAPPGPRATGEPDARRRARRGHEGARRRPRAWRSARSRRSDGLAIAARLSSARASTRSRWSAPHAGSRVVPANLTSAARERRRARGRSADRRAAARRPTASSAAHAPTRTASGRAWLALLAALALAARRLVDDARAARAVAREAARVIATRARACGRSPPGAAAPRSSRVRRHRRSRSRSARGHARPERPGAWRCSPARCRSLYEGLVWRGAPHARRTSASHRPRALLLVAAVGRLHRRARCHALPQRHGPGARAGDFTALSRRRVLAAALAVAEPELGRPARPAHRHRRARSHPLDRSRPRRRARIRARAAGRRAVGMHDDDRIGTVAFGAEAATEDPPRPRSRLPPPQRVEVGRDGDRPRGRDPPRARRGAGRRARARIVLVTDGVQTRGDALAAAAAAVAADVPVDVCVLEQKLVPDVRVVARARAARADEGEPIELRVVTSSAGATDVELRLRRDDGELFASARAHIDAGEDVLRTPRDGAGARACTATTWTSPRSIRASTRPPEDNVGQRLRARARRRRSRWCSRATPARARRSRKRARGQRLPRRRAAARPACPPTSAASPATTSWSSATSARPTLRTTQIDALASYARDLGGGLRPDGRRSRDGAGRLRAHADRGGVAGRLRSEAGEAARVARRGDRHRLSAARWAPRSAGTPSSSWPTRPRRARRRCSGRAIGWASSTSTPSCAGASRSARSDRQGRDRRGNPRRRRRRRRHLRRHHARRRLRRRSTSEKVNLKHLLLFADGSDAEQIAGCRPIVADAFDARDHHQRHLARPRERLARSSRCSRRSAAGASTSSRTRRKLPAVFTQETILAARSALAREAVPASARGVPAAPTRGHRLRRSARRSRATWSPSPSRAPACCSAGPRTIPSSPSWCVGIGRAAAFTSDFKDRWGSAGSAGPARRG